MATFLAQRALKKYTLIKEHADNCFLFKLIHSELLTFENREKHHPNLYGNSNTKCCFCNDTKETLEHLLTCQNNHCLTNMKLKIVEKFLKKLRKIDLNIKKLVDATTKLMKHLLDTESLRLLAIGIFSTDLWNLIKKPKQANKINNIIIKTCRSVHKKLELIYG